MLFALAASLDVRSNKDVRSRLPTGLREGTQPSSLAGEDLQIDYRSRGHGSVIRRFKLMSNPADCS